jgi:hypothetical protein
MYYEKEKNGDHLLLEDIKPENILVSIVADGITKQPCPDDVRMLNKFNSIFG